MQIRALTMIFVLALSMGCQGVLSMDGPPDAEPATELGSASPAFGAASGEPSLGEPVELPWYESDGGYSIMRSANAGEKGPKSCRAKGRWAICEDDDGCCPAGCDAATDNDCVAPICGDGVTDAGESCDGDCPVACDDADACTTDTLTGSAATCDAVCVFDPVTACVGDDGCCPSGCDSTNDSDCTAVCGDGVVEDAELCDGDCPTSCDDGDACTVDALSGSAASCDAQCSYEPVTACVNGDGCCASGCDATNDDDCAAMCGNGVEEGNELCDGNCPTTCDDGDACTTDAMTGSAATCDAMCSNTAVTACGSGDGCCPAGCTFDVDSDCPEPEPEPDPSGGIDCTNPATWPADWKAYEDEVIVLVNQRRAAGADCGSRGTFGPAQAVSMNPELQQAGRCHSYDMDTNGYFSHTSLDGRSFVTRARDAGYGGSLRGENIAAGYSSPSSVVTGWMNSDGHCANIMNSGINRMGIGYSNVNGRYWTMVTGTGD